MSKKITAMDGNTAAGYVGYMMSEIAAIYPITPSSPMAEYGDELAAINKKNIFGRIVKFAELQSEGGAAGAVHGSLAAGAMTTTYTASQGLLLMIPNMYKIAGEKLPTVFHVSARTIASHALSIFGDHSDVMATRQTGFIMIASNNSQEVMDLAFISHIATYKAHLPILHFFDGFRTSHEITKVEVLDDELMRSMVPHKEIAEFRKNAHNPVHPKQTGTAQNPDIFFQATEASNRYYDEAYDIVESVMNEFGKKTGRVYQPFQYVGDPNATDVIVLMGSGCDTVEETVNYLNKHGDKKGVLKVHLYRPFNAKAFLAALPKSVKRISVLDRTKEHGSLGEPLYLDVVAALVENNRSDIKCLAGRYGLACKEFTPLEVFSVFENMIQSKPQNHFTVGIEDDVTNLSLPMPTKFKGLDSEYYEMKFYGLGSDGTVSANKSSIKIIGELTPKYVQGYFEYDSKKSGSLTTSHLRVSDKSFYTPYLVKHADFIAIHNYAFINQYDVLDGLKKGGCVLLNTSLTDEQLARDLPETFKKHLVDSNAKMFVIPAFDVAKAAGLGNRINVIMQACFFKISNIIPYAKAEEEMKKFATKAYGKKGEKILTANMKAIDSATTDLHEVDVKKIINTKTESFTQSRKMSDYFKKWVNKINSRHGDSMKVSEFNADGSVPNGTTQYEKRGIGLNVPVWNPEKCAQCGQCAFVCPHAAIRSFLISDGDLANAPRSLKSKTATAANAKFVVQVSPLDCTGCESCARTCPVNKIAKEGETKTLQMTELRQVVTDQENNWEFVNGINQVKQTKFPETTVLGVQFKKPYFEFSGACSGCGETPYVTLVSRLFGDSMLVANATGCSSIYGGSAPSNPYTIDKEGYGPSWANSLFEDNAEFGFGMRLATDYLRDEAYERLTKIAKEHGGELEKAINELITVKDKADSKVKAQVVANLLNKVSKNEDIQKALQSIDQLPKKSQWIIGGDGWAYDIGYGGLDHVIAQNENVNILVLDTEVYSNTGGQASKSTPAGSIAKFAANGKVTRKKDLGLIAMSYKQVYVAQVAMGANQAQLIKALIEAESYNGPSIVIAYAPCINHGINLSNAQAIQKKAVDTGYWTLYRYDPRNEKAPLTIDSPTPTKPYQEFLDGENRYVSLMKKSPEHAKILFEASAKEAVQRRNTLLQMVAEQSK